MERQIRQDKKELIVYHRLLNSDNKDLDIDIVQNEFNITSNKLKQKERESNIS